MIGHFLSLMRNEHQQIIDQIQKSKNIFITFGKNHTGDAMSSALALYLFLKKLDKNVRISSNEFTGIANIKKLWNRNKSFYYR